MSRFTRLTSRQVLQVAALLPLAILAACSAGGAGTTVNQPTSNSTSSANAYTGPAPQNADVQAFKTALWQNISPANRCGGCHHAGGQSPMFARSDDINLAYQAALPLVNLTQPAQSTLVSKVGGGHNCWVADPQSCADTMTTWIQNWVGGSAAATSVQLVAPPSQTVASSKQFPADSSGFQQYVWGPILTKFCVNCHSPNASTPQQPYFAGPNPDDAYIAAQPKMDLNDPASSRFVERLAVEFHNCWATTPGGPPDCPGSAAAMLAAITNYANTVAITPVDPSLVLSKALQLPQATIAAGGNRVEDALVAKYEFKTESGTTAYDTSGVSPEADLTLTGNVTWVSGWGIDLGAGAKAQASTAASSKLASMIQASGEYTIEAWAAPANVAQTNAWIVSYSGSNTTRNATLGQHAMQYEGYTRSSTTNTNGMPPLQTAAANMNAQAALQHIVLTYDPVNGQKLYVNGVFTGDIDPSKGGSLASWDNTFALVLGNEVDGTRQWQGVIKFVEIQNRALTAAEVQQNFAAGVGEQYYMLFDVSAQTGVSQAYIMMTASVYDNYSYLFTNPTFISLDPNATAPSGVVLKGMRIGVNGVVGLPGQSYATLSTTLGGSTYSAKNGQLLSTVGAVIPSDKGEASDVIFLSFDQLGSATHVFTDPTPIVAAPTDNPASPDMGVRDFQEINATLSVITGVPTTDMAVNTQYNSLQQSLPASPQIAAFVASEQTAISQLAGTYCSELVGNQSYRDTFFTSALDANLNATSASYFGSSGPTANRNVVINAITANAVGSGVNTSYSSAITTELNNLLDKIATVAPATTVSAATSAACSAALGSAAVTLK